MLTWQSDTFISYCNYSSVPSFGRLTLGNHWQKSSTGTYGQIFSWSQYNSYSQMNTLINSNNSWLYTPSSNNLYAGVNNSYGFNYSNPFASYYQKPQFFLSTFNPILPTTSSNQSVWNNMGLNLSTRSNSSNLPVQNAPSSGSISCSTQNIRSKNAPYQGYDKSPHSAVNASVNNYTKYGNNKHIAQLEPDFQLKIMKIIDYAKQHGYEFKITSSFRTRGHQDRLRKKYVNQKGRAAKTSPHMFGKAIDFQVLKNGRKCNAGYDLVGKYAESLGVRWGARFQTCKERWHFDYNWVG